jgi:hypothetical protein
MRLKPKTAGRPNPRIQPTPLLDDQDRAVLKNISTDLPMWLSQERG